MANEVKTYRHTVTGIVAEYPEDFAAVYSFFEEVEPGAKDKLPLSVAVERGKGKAKAPKTEPNPTNQEED